MQTTFPEARTPDLFGDWQCDECGDNIDALRFTEEELHDPDTVILCLGYCLTRYEEERYADR